MEPEIGSVETSSEGAQAGRCAPTLDEQFYTWYLWCLNPLLTLRDEVQRLCEELDRYQALTHRWQREESAINLYLFTCGLACTVDDYQAWRPWNLAKLSEWFPVPHPVVATAEQFLNLPHLLRSRLRNSDLAEWTQAWRDCVETVCESLAFGTRLNPDQLEIIRRAACSLLSGSFPRDLLMRRLRLPEGFRRQDLTHHDLLVMADRFAAQSHDHNRPLLVVGSRTFGSYFAPLVKVCLSRSGWAQVDWMAIRPKWGLARSEKKQLRAFRSPDCRILVVDDYPNTGKTISLILNILERSGIRPEMVTVLVPRHPARAQWSLPHGIGRGAKILTFEPDNLYKRRLLEPSSMMDLLREYFSGLGWQQVTILETPVTEAINRSLWAHYSDGFDVRVKRVFEVSLATKAGNRLVIRIIAKSVGWGWLGYHAYVAGTRLAGYIPRVLTVRQGFLLSEWINGISIAKMTGPDSKIQHLASYVATRTHRLGLSEDPRYEGPERGWGWLEMISILRRAYGVHIGRLKDESLFKALVPCMCPVPTLTDGRISPNEWIETEDGMFKLDFEHHNFGPPELDVVDPAYDLAGAVFEFHLSENAEEELVQSYIRETGDGKTIADRLFLYKLLYGTVVARKATEAIAAESSRERNEEDNRRYLSARSFLIETMNRFASRLLRTPGHEGPSNGLFFLDLDGVFDSEMFGFPHTTVSGLAALSLLRSAGFSVVLNTGRSVEHVRKYCTAYEFRGGIAEYGSVFWDAIGRRTVPFVDDESIKELLLCRDALQEVLGAFVDPQYEYSIRTYRFKGGRTVGLDLLEAEKLLSEISCMRLSVISRPEDTYIVRKGVNKGQALHSVKHFLGNDGGVSAAIGDANEDLTMLQVADFSYAPSNCSNDIRRLGRRKKWKILREPRQRGLLEGVRDLLGDPPLWTEANLLHPEPGDDLKSLLLQLLSIVEKTRLRRTIAAFS